MRRVSATSATRRAIAALSSLRSTSGKARFWRAVMCGKSARFWNTMARLRSFGPRSPTGVPPMRTVPVSGATSPSRRRRIVVLPELGGPKTQWNSLSSTTRSTSFTATVRP